MVKEKINSSALKKELNKSNLGSFYKTVGGNEGDKCFYPTRLDTYGKGCYFNCKYCYAKSLLDFRHMWNPNSPAMPPLKDIVKVIKTIPKGSVIRLGGMTDCFQPIEKIKRHTYKTIKLLNRKGIHYLIVTKSHIIADDEYLDLMDKKLAHIQVSIPTTDNLILRNTDNGKSFESRKNVVETLYDNDFDVSLRLAPFFYNTCDFDEINSVNVDKCLVEFLRIPTNKRNDLAGIVDIKEYDLVRNNYHHLPLNKKLAILDNLDFKELSVCDDVEEHYQYFLKNVCFNSEDCCNLRL